MTLTTAGSVYFALPWLSATYSSGSVPGEQRLEPHEREQHVRLVEGRDAGLLQGGGDCHQVLPGLRRRQVVLGEDLLVVVHHPVADAQRDAVLLAVDGEVLLQVRGHVAVGDRPSSRRRGRVGDEVLLDQVLQLAAGRPGEQVGAVLRAERGLDERLVGVLVGVADRAQVDADALLRGLTEILEVLLPGGLVVVELQVARGRRRRTPAASREREHTASAAVATAAPFRNSLTIHLCCHRPGPVSRSRTNCGPDDRRARLETVLAKCRLGARLRVRRVIRRTARRDGRGRRDR